MITRLRRLRFRLRRGVAEQGLAATVRAGLRRFLGAEFEFVWYAAEPARIRRLRLREGYEFRIATEAEVTAWLTAVPAIDPSTGPNRITGGSVAVLHPARRGADLQLLGVHRSLSAR